ncbi:MAG: hypothetical protein WAK93_18970 [Solirubrobacteraceae bacterium]
MDEQDRGSVIWTGEGDVDAQTPGVDVVVSDAVQRRGITCRKRAQDERILSVGAASRRARVDLSPGASAGLAACFYATTPPGVGF